GERILFPHLPTYKFDQELKADENDNIYKEYFNSLSVLMKNYNWSQDLFNKLSRNIKLVHDKYVPGDAFNRKRCYDLNFWLYDQVFNKLKSTSEYDTKFFKDTSTRLQEVWKNIVDAKFKGQAFECYPDKDLLLNMGYLQEIKDLLDFFEDYNEMKNEIINNTYNGCRRYVNYLKQRIPVYYAWRDSCKVKEFACKRYIDDYMKYRPSSIVPKLSPLIVVMYAYTPCYKSVYDVFVKAKLQPKRNDGIYKKNRKA
ncbi:CYIR protein, partial [Plasmodium cynomolgi strain B]